MDIVSLIVVYICVWWVVLFMALQFGVRRDEAIGTGAPMVTGLKKKIIITSLISLVLTGIIYGLIVSNIIDFYAIANEWSQEDYKR